MNPTVVCPWPIPERARPYFRLNHYSSITAERGPLFSLVAGRDETFERVDDYMRASVHCLSQLLDRGGSLSSPWHLRSSAHQLVPLLQPVAQEHGLTVRTGKEEKRIVMGRQLIDLLEVCLDKPG